MLKQISWNYASYSQNIKHESITSNSISQTSYIQVKMKLSTQKNSILLKNQTKLNFMLPSADKLYGDTDFIFQQDLAPAHSAKSTKSWFNDHVLLCLTGQQTRLTWTS